MKFTRLIPNVFYTDINAGIRLFIDCLGFRIAHEELKSHEPFCVVEKDGLRLMLFQNKELADRDRPEFRFETNNIDEVYQKVSTTHPQYLHPNLRQVTLRPWGAKEFAMIDESGVCIIIQQW